MAKRIMVITVGTSLYQSASWQTQSVPLAKNLGYSRWVHDYLDNPRRRASMVEGDCGSETGIRIELELQALLKVENATEWARYVERDMRHPLRYSAELATMIKLYDLEGQHYRDLSGFLSEIYSVIHLVTDEDTMDHGHIAAHHLLEQIKIFVPEVSDLPKIEPKIAGQHLDNKMVSLSSVLALLPVDSEVDLLLSGAYKIYSMVASMWLTQREKWRAIYLHQERDHLVRLTKDSIQIENRPPRRYSMGRGGTLGAS